MPRPSRNLTRVSVYLPATALDGLDLKAARLSEAASKLPHPEQVGDAGKVTRSDVIRLAVENYLRSKP